MGKFTRKNRWILLRGNASWVSRISAIVLDSFSKDVCITNSVGR